MLTGLNRIAPPRLSCDRTRARGRVDEVQVASQCAYIEPTVANDWRRQRPTSIARPEQRPC
jgi:hypothetical protein